MWKAGGEGAEGAVAGGVPELVFKSGLTAMSSPLGCSCCLARVVVVGLRTAVLYGSVDSEFADGIG